MHETVIKEELNRLIDCALAEDIGGGDVTTLWTIPNDAATSGRFTSRTAGRIAGLEAARLTFERLDMTMRFQAEVRDGDRIEAGRVFAEIDGATRSVLTGERTALNFLRHLSGIASLTDQYVGAVAGTGVRIVDTRKTTPGFRMLEKEAVRAGGGDNHRFGLFDMVLIKDNHIAAAGSITAAVNRCRSHMTEQQKVLKIEVEAETLDQVREAAGLKVDRIMLDNMSPDTMRTAVAQVREASTGHGHIELEASGAIMLEHVRGIAETGVDLISIGALTHSAPALDVSLEIT